MEVLLFSLSAIAFDGGVIAEAGHRMTSKPMNDVVRLIVGAKEESLVVLVDDGRLVEMERRLVVEGNPPEFFYLVA